MTQDTVITDDAKEGQHSKDVELADVAAEVSESAQIIDETVDEDAVIADVAAEVADAGAAIDEKDMEVAEVAAEVAESAKMIQKADEKDVVFVDAANEGEKIESGDVAETVSAVAPPPAPPAALTVRGALYSSWRRLTVNCVQSFSAFSSAASPFASVAPPSESPFGAFSSPIKPPTPTPAAVSKPRAMTSFAVPFVPSPATAAAAEAAQSTPVPPRTLHLAPATTTFGTPLEPLALGGLRAPPPTPATPVPSTPASKTPFSAFASSSGFGTVSTPLSSNAFGSSSTASSSKLNPTASSNVFGTPSGSSAFGSYSASHSKTVSSAFANIQASSENNESSAESERKLGEPVEVDATRRVFTEQEGESRASLPI